MWIAFAVLAIASFAVPDGTIPSWLKEIPPQWRLGLDKAISSFMNWLVDDATFGLFTFREATRAVSAFLNVPLTAATAIFSTGLLRGSGSTAVQLAPPLPWIAVVGVAAALGYRFGGMRLALLAGGAFLYLAVFGQWASAMTTLASIAIAVPLGVAGGVLFGILGYRVPLARRIMEPILDLMQTVPIFAYLIPILFLFGFGPVAALIATMIYAMPPMVRVTMTALEAVPREIVEYGTMAGTTRWQMLFKVMLPAARPQLLVGVNQVIMLSLNMVIIASMIGAGGLGYDVLTALRRLDIGGGYRGGACHRRARHRARPVEPGLCVAAGRQAEVQDRSFIIGLLAFTAAVYVLGLFLPAVAIYPASLQLSTAPWWGEAVRWFNVNYFDTMDAIKSALLLNVLIPVKRFMVAQTWPLLVAALAFAGWRLGGARLAALAGGLTLFIALNGQWENAMVTVYLCGVSVIVASAIGIPLGIMGGLSTPLLAHSRARHRHAADLAELRLPDSGGHAVQGRRLHRDDRHRALCAGAGSALHGTRHSQRSAFAHRGRHGRRLHARPAPDQDPPPPGDAHHSARHQPDGDARALHARHHRAGRHPRSRPGGVHGLDQGRYRARAGRRALRRGHRHHRRPADPDRGTQACRQTGSAHG